MALDKSYGLALGWPLAPGQYLAPYNPQQPALALTFSSNLPLQFSDGLYLEFSA